MGLALFALILSSFATTAHSDYVPSRTSIEPMTLSFQVSPKRLRGWMPKTFELTLACSWSIHNPSTGEDYHSAVNKLVKTQSRVERVKTKPEALRYYIDVLESATLESPNSDSRDYFSEDCTVNFSIDMQNPKTLETLTVYTPPTILLDGFKGYEIVVKYETGGTVYDPATGGRKPYCEEGAYWRHRKTGIDIAASGKVIVLCKRKR